MPELARLAPFFFAVLVLELTPGPNMGYLAVVAGQAGRRAGLVTIAGVTAGLGLCLLASIGGLAELMAARPSWLEALRWLGVGYFLWLAADAWRTAGRPADPARIDEPRLFVRGFVSNLLNPKAALLYVSLLPGFLDPDAGRVEVQALALGLVHIAVSIAVHLAIVLGAARAADALAGDGRLVALQRGAALLLVAVAAWLAAGAFAAPGP
ncbi:LysE family translocator [Phenylobacterium sp. J426]|uniref:LysE family translocator n=1 Tax=Phenylobacterium sp. J426 TaxID=2898439 RepID=UPI00215119AF|nr:LysE family translocator [Phenylobacterium sp. J426]MCR5875523.1 LysE family translocator [Phenylobacterium sp. J426]